MAPHWLIWVPGPKTWGWCTFFHFLLICQFIVALLHQSDKNDTKIKSSKMMWRCYIEMDLDIFDFNIFFFVAPPSQNANSLGHAACYPI